MLYHVSRIKYNNIREIVLVPGPQGTEGEGVYFSENAIRITAAEGSRGCNEGTIFCINVPSNISGWFRTKPGICKKYGRPRTWHTKGKPIKITNLVRFGEFNGFTLVKGELKNETDNIQIYDDPDHY